MILEQCLDNIIYLERIYDLIHVVYMITKLS